MRRQGTWNLLAAATATGAHFLAQSIAWQLPADASAAVRQLERLVLGANGVVLRYGRIYGPGTYYENEKPKPPRVHVNEAARRTVPALDAASGSPRSPTIKRARRAPDGAARRAIVRSAWLGVVDGSAEAIGERVARVFVELAGL
jgi:hypothetical protein